MRGVIVHARPCGALHGASRGPSALPIREEVLPSILLFAFLANQNFESLVGCIIMPAIGETFQVRGLKEWSHVLMLQRGVTEDLESSCLWCSAPQHRLRVLKLFSGQPYGVRFIKLEVAFWW